MSRQKYLPWVDVRCGPSWMAWWIEKSRLHFSPNIQPKTSIMTRNKTRYMQPAICTLRRNHSCTLHSVSSVLSHIHYSSQDTFLFLFIARKSVSQCPRLSSLSIVSPQGPQKHPCRKVSSWNVWQAVITLLRTFPLSMRPVSSFPVTVHWDSDTTLWCWLGFENYTYFISPQFEYLVDS